MRPAERIAVTAMGEAAQLLPQIALCNRAEDVAAEADAIALLTEWKQFRLVDFKPVREKMRGIAFFDGRNQYGPSDLRAQGFEYFGIGR